MALVPSSNLPVDRANFIPISKSFFIESLFASLIVPALNNRVPSISETTSFIIGFSGIKGPSAFERVQDPKDLLYHCRRGFPFPPSFVLSNRVDPYDPKESA